MTFCFKSFIAIVLASQVTIALADNQTAIDLAKPAQEMKKQLPQELAEGLLLTDVTYDSEKKTLIYSATALDTQPDQISQDYIVNKICYTPLLRNAIKKDIIVSFFFYNEYKKLLKHIVVSESLCQTNFKHFETALTENLKQTNPTLLPMVVNDRLTVFNLAYQSAKKSVVVDIKASNNKVDTKSFSQQESIKIACTDDYLSLFMERDLGYIFNYYNSKGDQLIKTFTVGSKDCQPNQSDDTNKALDKKLAEDAQIMKKNLKAMSTDQIELIGVGYDTEKRIIWNEAIIKDPMITQDKININTSIASLCTNPSTRETINHGVAYAYSYYDSHHQPMINFLVDANVCKGYDKDHNILLQSK